MDPMEKLAALAAELEKKIDLLSEKKAEDEKQAADLFSPRMWRCFSKS